jgi:hypothetical protein
VDDYDAVREPGAHTSCLGQHYTGQTGSGCQATVTGTRVDFPKGFYTDVVDPAMEALG